MTQTRSAVRGPMLVLSLISRKTPWQIASLGPLCWRMRIIKSCLQGEVRIPEEGTQLSGLNPPTPNAPHRGFAQDAPNAPHKEFAQDDNLKSL